jgi:hypothetical protein
LPNEKDIEELPNKSTENKNVFPFIKQPKNLNLFGQLTADMQGSKSESLFTKQENNTFIKNTASINPFTKIVKVETQFKKTDEAGASSNAASFWKSMVKISEPVNESNQQSKNLFGSLIRKNEDSENEKNKIINQIGENLFQSLHLELIKDLSNELMQSYNIFSNEIENNIFNLAITEEIKRIYCELINIVKSSEYEKQQLALRQKQETIMLQIEKNILDEYVASLIDTITREDTLQFIQFQTETENRLFDELLCNVFKQEFEIILKQIANELNNELIRERLIESVYFSPELSANQVNLSKT